MPPPRCASPLHPEREFFIDNLLVRIHFINVMMRWTGLAPWEFEFPFPGSLTATSLEQEWKTLQTAVEAATVVREADVGRSGNRWPVVTL